MNWIEVDLVENSQKVGLYHFKVVELKTFTDTMDNNEVKTVFHFFFQLILTKHQVGLEKFSWNYQSHPVQKIYLSQDTMKLMEVLNDTVAILYERTKVGTSEIEEIFSKEQDGEYVQWNVLFRIKSLN